MDTGDRRRMDTLAGCPIEPRDDQVKHGGSEPVIIGGMVLDIHATPSIPANPGTTTPGKVHYVLGGVARNVAECMSKLGIKLYMISAVGLDMAGNLLLEHWRSSGLAIEGIQRCQDVNTAVVCNIFDPNGELAAAVASVEVIERFLTTEWIRKFKYNILTAPVVMVDANLNPSALETACHMAANSDVPVWFEPVSVAKSRRVASVVKYITFASPNEDELIAMANSLSCGGIFYSIQRDGSQRHSIGSLFQMLKPAIWVLLDKGVEAVLVTLGSEGVFLCSKGGYRCMKLGSKKISPSGPSEPLYKLVTSTCPSNHRLFSSMKSEESSHFLAVHFPALPTSVVRLTGAGDCLVGGTIASICAGLDVFRSVAVGIAAAKGAVESERNVPAEFSLSKLADDASKVYAAAKVLFHQSML